MKFFSFLQIMLVALCGALVGCDIFESEPSSGEFILYPKNELSFKLYPNDAAFSDSVAANLAKGVVLLVSPGSSYKLSFEADESNLPKELQLFRSFEKQNNFYYQIVRHVKGNFENGRMVYEFTCAENFASEWFTTLRGKEKSFYEGSIKNVKFEGEGLYSNSISLNLVVTGEFTEMSDSISIDSLAKALRNSFAMMYKLKIDTVYISNAADNANGAKYPKNRPFVVPYSTARMLDEVSYSDLAVWEDKAKSKALDIMLVHRIDKDAVLGYSFIFGRSMMENGNVVVLATHITYGQDVEQLSSEDIISSAIHEAGHFFGLRHTTSTADDLKSWGDSGIKEDGLEDTEWCPSIVLRKQVENEIGRFGDVLHRVRKNYTVSFDCPDNLNVMYPYDSGIHNQSFSKMQLELVKKNLTLIVH